jgi:hypothetical protein
MKLYKLILTEIELQLLDGMSKHCLKNKDRFIFSHPQNTETIILALEKLEGLVLKIKNAVEVDG